MDLAALMYVFVVIAIVAVPGFILVRHFVLRRRVVCPADGREHKVKILCSSTKEGLIPKKVKGCDAFANPRNVDCDQECLEQIPKPLKFKHGTRSKA